MLQGFGNVGAWAAQLYQEGGGRVIAVSGSLPCHMHSAVCQQVLPEGSL